MAKFLNTSGTTYHLEELIKKASDRLIIISPYLKLNDRIKELLEDRNRFKIDIRIVYGKNDLQPAEVQWLKNLEFIRTSFCKNLHAKCYLNESQCIITSLNLYEFSQVNNNEMGVLIYRDEDSQLYTDTYEEAQRIIRISDEVRLSIETVKPSKDSYQQSTSHSKPNGTTPSPSVDKGNITAKLQEPKPAPTETASASTMANSNAMDNTESQSSTATPKPTTYDKLTTSKLAKKLGLKTADLNSKLVELGYLTENDGKFALTDAGQSVGGEAKRGQYGEFIIWSAEMVVR